MEMITTNVLEVVNGGIDRRRIGNQSYINLQEVWGKAEEI